MHESEINQYTELIKSMNQKIFSGGTIDVGEAYNMICMIETLLAEVENLKKANISVIRLVGNMARGANGASAGK